MGYGKVNFIYLIKSTIEMNGYFKYKVKYYLYIFIIISPIGGIIALIGIPMDKKKQSLYYNYRIYSIIGSKKFEALYVLKESNIKNLQKYYIENSKSIIDPKVVGNPLYYLPLKNSVRIVDTINKDIIKFEAIVYRNERDYKIKGFTYISNVHQLK